MSRKPGTANHSPVRPAVEQSTTSPICCPCAASGGVGIAVTARPVDPPFARACWAIGGLAVSPIRA